MRIAESVGQTPGMRHSTHFEAYFRDIHVTVTVAELARWRDVQRSGYYDTNVVVGALKRAIAETSIV